MAPHSIYRSEPPRTALRWRSLAHNRRISRADPAPPRQQPPPARRDLRLVPAAGRVAHDRPDLPVPARTEVAIEVRPEGIHFDEPCPVRSRFEPHWQWLRRLAEPIEDRGMLPSKAAEKQRRAVNRHGRKARVSRRRLDAAGRRSAHRWGAPTPNALLAAAVRRAAAARATSRSSRGASTPETTRAIIATTAADLTARVGRIYLSDGLTDQLQLVSCESHDSTQSGGSANAGPLIFLSIGTSTASMSTSMLAMTLSEARQRLQWPPPCRGGSAGP
jgi:hypothetical protein